MTIRLYRVQVSRSILQFAITAFVVCATAFIQLFQAPLADAATRTVELSTTSSEFLDTGVKLVAGESATITVTGDGTCHVGGSSDCPGGPEGAGYTCGDNPVEGPQPPGPAGEAVPYGAVAGRIGPANEGTPFTIGASKHVEGPGELYVVYNDCANDYGDNGGSFQVSITTPGSVVNGNILDTRGNVAAGVPLTLTGTSSEGQAVSQSTTTGSNGLYSFEVQPGEYTVEASGNPKRQNGGSLAVTSVGDVPECTGTAKEASCKLDALRAGEDGHANFTYTACTATERTPKNEQLTGCPIIFIPGILGSRITCGSKELFFPLTGINFAEMQLMSDGKTNASGPCSSDAGVPEGEAGVLTNVGPIDAYGSMLAYLKKIATNGVYPFPYDWRKSVSIATEQLNAWVEKVLSETHAKHVVLVAHSMGGLVTQSYIDESSYAEKVSRAVTIGTPYNGAPKSIVALLSGYANEFSLEKLDLVFGGPDNVQMAARNYTGLFWLYPSSSYGPWLKIDGPGYPLSYQGANAIDPWVSSLGGNTSLLDSAEKGHEALDGFVTNGVDYEAIVGVGLPTITKLVIALNEVAPEQLVTASYGSGDGTVPAASQTQGDFPGNGSTVPIHYVCGVSHADEPGNPGVQERIEEFVLRGVPVAGNEPPCPYSGKEIELDYTPITNHGTPVPAYAATSSIPAGAMTIEQAIAAGKIEMQELGGHTLITTNEREPVTLALSGHGIAVRIRSVSSSGEGKPSYYGPLSGTVTIAANGTIRQGLKTLRAHGPGHAPRAIAHVSHHGRKYLVRLTASGRSGVAGIYTRIGKRARRRYSRPLLLTHAQLKALRFAAVDLLGDWEKPQRVRL